MKLIGICATSCVKLTAGTIGNHDGSSLWSIPEELKNFKKITFNHTVIMGRKTFEVIGKPLLGRSNIILSHKKNFHLKGTIVSNSVASVLQLIKKQKTCFVIGGKETFLAFEHLINYWFISWIKKFYQGDITMNWKRILTNKFELVKQKQFDEFIFSTYRRIYEKNYT